jgi:TPR repeat protein
MFGRRRKWSGTAQAPDQTPEFSITTFPAGTAGRQVAAGGSPAELNNLGVLLKKHGHHDEAAEWFRDAANAGNVDGMANLAIYLMAHGRNAEAADWFRRTGGQLGETIADRLLRTAEFDSQALQ